MLLQHHHGVAERQAAEHGHERREANSRRGVQAVIVQDACDHLDYVQREAVYLNGRTSAAATGGRNRPTACFSRVLRRLPDCMFVLHELNCGQRR
jgi:hypothetical protein